MSSINLLGLLQSTFGFPAFRANQEAVCRAATEGRDCLLVMPTGAGKSLCYQLPALARGGTALVVSPLIALMDDQANKLTAAGLRVGRIHSGLSREAQRQACRDYLDGSLQFLFIAPERLRVPGFVEHLARRKLSLIAIDEAHCISAWGHDFRPDYRTLGDHLPALRPAPIIALTATATPQVQQDIVAQLALTRPALFIHGFRRDNLHIEVLELSKPRRTEFTTTFLDDPSRRPAIVYAPSRKAAEELAGELGRHFPTAAYHAGLEPATRERVQRHFQSGKLEVVVATIAFGMGIDKADVRTVVHLALPASVEAYYQEIGRAGRDGQPSRTVLLYSYADRKMHDFFLERDYPVPSELTRIARLLTDDFQTPDLLRQRLEMDAGTFDKAVEKLAAQGAAALDLAGNVRATGNAAWQSSYQAQVQHRRGQIDRIMHFADTQQCRMTALIRHFGDTADAHQPCGHCDFCNPTATSAQTFAEPSAHQDRDLRAILRALDGTSRSTGRLYTDLTPSLKAAPDRKAFDALLDGLARAGLLTLASETFTNPEGNVIPYKKASLTHEGQTLAPGAPLQVLLAHASHAETKSKKKKSSVPHSSRSHRDEGAATAFTPIQKTSESALRAFRKAEAAKTGKPAFIVFSDTTLDALVRAAPRTIPELLSVSGFGPGKAERYGAAITAIFRNEPPLDSALDFRRSTASRSISISSQPTHAGQTENSVTPPKLTPERSWKETSRLIKEDFTYLNPSSKKARLRSREYDEAVYRRLDFEEDLLLFARRQADSLKVSPDEIVSHSLIAQVLRLRPRSMEELQRLDELRGDLPKSFYKAMLEVCNADYATQQDPLKQPQPRRTAVDESNVRKPAVVYTDSRRASLIKERTSPVQQFGEPSPTFTRPPTPTPEPTLTPAQQSLELRLRDWRKAESERLGLPQFFVLGTSALRSIVLIRPGSLIQLETIVGIGHEKAEKYGPAILQVCQAATA